MKKQLFLNFSLALTIAASFLNTTAIKVNAGAVNAEGSTLESSGYSGSNFTPSNQTANPQISPGIRGAVEFKKGKLRLSPTQQANINEVASNIINQAAITEVADGNSSRNIGTSNANSDKTASTFDINNGENISISPTLAAVAIITGETNPNRLSEIQNVLIDIGVKSASVEKLINSMLGMVNSSAAKELKPSKKLAQNNQPNVDINKLNAAINAYNQIIMESDRKTLNKLAQNPEFMAIRNIINQLRIALNA